ncbi:hypothetical protein [Flavobacterium sp. SM2513]|uniref:hypothetical protein n=1 Tax=Flavobacterium sp. SM2513 TaxID=3424766 RepID=UPI003D7FFC2E
MLSKYILIREKKLIENNFDFLKCTIKNDNLLCEGICKPTQLSVEYKFQINYDGKKSPQVNIIDPVISYNDDIHMFPSDNSLCLYHSSDMVWDYKKHNLFDTIIPWSIEWFVFYEIYLISGKWEHPFVPHKSTKEYE